MILQAAEVVCSMFELTWWLLEQGHYIGSWILGYVVSCCSEVCSSSGQQGSVHEIKDGPPLLKASNCPRTSPPKPAKNKIDKAQPHHPNPNPDSNRAAWPVPHPFPDPFPLSLGCNALTLVLSPHGESSSIEAPRASETAGKERRDSETFLSFHF